MESRVEKSKFIEFHEAVVREGMDELTLRKGGSAFRTFIDTTNVDTADGGQHSLTKTGMPFVTPFSKVSWDQNGSEKLETTQRPSHFDEDWAGVGEFWRSMRCQKCGLMGHIATDC